VCQEMATLPAGVCVQCFRMVDLPIRLSVANTVRPSVDAVEMITPAQELGTPIA
jgi:hypothetical protein